MIDSKTLHSLEFDKILSILSDFAVSDVSKRQILDTIPSFDYDEVVRLQALTQEAYITDTKYNLSPVIIFDDVSEVLAKANIDAILQMSELLKVARLIKSARIAKKEIESTGSDIEHLKILVSSIFIQTELEKSITDSIESENEMKDNASEKLFALRKKIRQADSKLKEKLHSYTRSSDISKYLQDNLITVRGGRFVLPVKSECRGNIPGLIHDQSASGSTVFIEPFPIVDLNNEIKSLRMEEAQEIERILKILSQMVQASLNKLQMCQEACIMLDIIHAKHAFSLNYNCITPKLNTKNYVNLINARHPLIEKSKIVPVDVSFGKDYRMLMITGPNTGGKTVCLKTVGLFCLMTYCGMKIPCGEESEIAVFDNIFCDIGDEQSILSSLSTFSSHIVNLISITEKITNNSLVLLDELGGGTDPSEGAALAIGIIKFLELMKVSGILTTHYGELKEYAILSKNIKNGCMQFDDETLKPTYKLIMGIPGISNALKIAKMLGLNNYIIKEAENSLKEEKIQFELVLQDALKSKTQALNEAKQAEILRNELLVEKEMIIKERNQIKERLDKINSNAAIETKRIVNKNVGRAEELIDEMKELIKIADEKALFKARQLKKEIEDIQYLTDKNDFSISYKDISADDLKIGQKVIVKSIGATGEVISIRKNEADIHSGSAILKVKISELAYNINDDIKQKMTKQNSVSKTPTEHVKSTESSLRELKVLGLTVNEAIEIIYPHIMSGIGQNIILKIIHGKGTGALGRGIQNFLKSEHSVKNYRYGDYTEGGTGVTLAEIE